MRKILNVNTNTVTEIRLTEEEQAVFDAQEAEWAAGADDRAAAEVRTERDKLLAESDWVTTRAVDQNAADNLGIQVPQVWLDYRQALRDITAQDGFPHNVIWPEVQ